MKKIINLYTILGFSFLALFLLLIILLSIDRATITFAGKEVGLSHLNNLVSYKFDDTLDKVSDVLFYFSFSGVILGVVLGIMQLVKNKSLFAVDTKILFFGIFVILAIIFWLVFDKGLKINYRPIDPTEGSFPSTHVFMTTFFMLAAHNLLCSLFKGNNIVKYGSLAVAIIFIVLVTIFRVSSGMHYITDVIGGLFIGLSFYFLAFGLGKAFVKQEENATN